MGPRAMSPRFRSKAVSSSAKSLLTSDMTPMHPLEVKKMSVGFTADFCSFETRDPRNIQQK